MKLAVLATAVCTLAITSTVPLMGAYASTGDSTTVTTELLPSAKLLAQQDDSLSSSARLGLRRAFVEEQVRQGRLVDIAATRSAIFDGVASVWETGLTPGDLELRTAKDASGKSVAESMKSTASLVPGSTSSAGGTSLGMNSALAISGATFQSGYCTTTTSTTGNKLTSCYQEYKLTTSTSTRDFFYYNRYATAAGKAITLAPDWVPTRIDVRSRPWSTYSGDVAALVDFWPKAGVSSCNDHSITVSYGAFSGQMPIQDCSDVTPDPDATSKTMVVIYDQGSVFSGRVHGTDMSLIYSTFKGKNPSYADYSYANYCLVTYLKCDGVLRKDSGW